ncbi:MAG TPA: bifunctional serine/threonine-protein kinase/formylglycine-generating enzyme family protein [Terriglobia bacterium]|nr:bifunctional serine/threonine-protein kinase/formylglycine-generating enzyme family protein [Terriglobia bacterium]
MPEQVSSYRLEEEIARGSMGIVYRAVHTVFEEIVAIKAILPELTLNSELRQRFLNEAKIQRSLEHPNIVQIRKFLIHQEKLYIVMEFIEGETLADRLRRLGRPMPVSEVILIFRQMLEGLGFAHSHGVIHRDIKPSNIMLTSQGVAKLTDFGIAHAMGSAKLTRTGKALGAPAYMSPEQIQGAQLDHRTDIYSLGAVLYQMLTGRVPFEHPEDSDSDYAVLTAHINQAPTPPSHGVPNIPPPLEAATLKALEKRPENRFASCEEFQAGLLRSPASTTGPAIVPQPEPGAPMGVEPRPQPSERKDYQQAMTPVRENPKDGLKYVWIPPGVFMMGCSPGDNECYDNEKPSHRVTITKGFWVGQTEVTVGAFKRFAAATGRQLPPAPPFNSAWENENMPIVNVTWDDARAYCMWAGGRLPTEAEWEYAARGGTTDARHGIIDQIAWHAKNSGGRTHNVAQRRANHLGLSDVLGNVSEWVNDWFDDKYYQNSPSQDPPGPSSGQHRVLRGGSWSDFPWDIRVSVRTGSHPTARENNVGLRCAWEPE